MRNHKFIFILLVMPLLILSACGGSGEATVEQTLAESVPVEYAGKTNPLAGDAEAISAGGQTFESMCASCHGDRGQGDGPAGTALTPKPSNLAALQQQVEDDYLFWRVSDGKPGTAMIGWKTVLTEEKVWQVVAFLRTLE